MTRNEYDEMEATANVALAGLLAGDCQLANTLRSLWSAHSISPKPSTPKRSVA